MQTETEAATALITNDAVVLGLLAVILGAVFWASNLSHPWVKRFFTIIPALLLCYFLPSLLTTFGVVDPEESRLYFIASRFLLPAALVLRPFNTNTLAVRAFELASDERLADAALPALTILLAGVAPVILLTRSIRSLHTESPHAEH